MSADRRQSAVWWEHPHLYAETGVRTRIGVSAHQPSFRVGVLRTHLLTAVLAHAAAERLHTAAVVMLRCDDTNPELANRAYLPQLRRELTSVAGIDLSKYPRPPGARLPCVETALQTLGRLGVVEVIDGVACLDLHHAHARLRADGQDPEAAARAAVWPTPTRALRHGRRFVPLVRGDRSVLWHLATVVDDLEAGVNLVVRGADKRDAAAVQIPLWLLLAPHRPPPLHLHLPRMIEAGTPVRVAALLAQGTRPAALRWYLAEPYLQEQARPQTFADLVAHLRANLPVHGDSRHDPARLAAMDRKLSAVLDPTIAAAELHAAIDERHHAPCDATLVAEVTTTYRRPIPQQLRRYQQLLRASHP